MARRDFPGQAQDDAALARLASELADAVDAALAGWVIAAVAARAGGPAGVAVPARAAGERCRRELGAAVRDLLVTDIDDQCSTPLQILRRAVRYPTEVLEAAGVAAPARDEFARQMDPDDVYGLVPATWADFGPAVGDAGLRWGAAKAHVHLSRRRLD